MSLEFSIKTPIFVLSQIYEKNEPRGSLTTYELKIAIRHIFLFFLVDMDYFTVS